MGFLVEELVVTIKAGRWPVVAFEASDGNNDVVGPALVGVASCFDDHDLGVDNTHIESSGDSRFECVGGQCPIGEKYLYECPCAIGVAESATGLVEVLVVDIGERPGEPCCCQGCRSGQRSGFRLQRLESLYPDGLSG